ncbi:M23 family metallopeptidase [Bifidobacterium sp. LC6]|uniref:M23 family metallopeptidase n=1 Tax=Bifidobacterium colobi TaxID=2809026 RepID=A0ABS5UWE4_9BIFI|nr:M23 family metallopeptidase [Bifidobacterium colobi]MBT1175424.1 M23 family metallopeptidase [Bifidobacterium colobi]
MSGNWFDWRRQTVRRLMRQRSQERQRTEREETMRAAIVAACAVFGLLMALMIGLALSEASIGTQYAAHGESEGSSVVLSSEESPAGYVSAGQDGLTLADFTDMTALEQQVGAPCEARYGWPVENPTVAEAFDRPAAPWAAGHRGVDLQTTVQQTILAPKDGTISFAGRVGGKDVVSIRHRGGVTSTFEPAVTDLTVGATVSKGEEIGMVQGDSDHCEDSCLHWGLRRGAHDYLNPEAYAAAQKIVLKE